MNRRSDYLKALNQMRANYQNQGNPLINPTDDTTSVGNEISSFAYMNTQLPNATEEIKADSNRNGWQRIEDTSRELTNNFYEGLFNAADSLADAFIGLAGKIGGLFGADTDWAEDAIRYDWVAQATAFTDKMNIPTHLFNGDLFTEDYWNSYSVLSNPTASRKYINQTHTDSVVSELGNEFQAGYNSVTQGIGEMLPSIALATATGGQSLAVRMGTQAGLSFARGLGSGTEQALMEGADFDSAVKYGAASGTIEAATTAISYGLGAKITNKFGEGATGIISRTVGSVVGKICNNSATAEVVGAKIATVLVDAVAEAGEEAVQGLIDPVLKQITYDSNALDKAYGSSEAIQQTKQNILQTMLIAGITSAVLGGVGEFGSLVNKENRTRVTQDYFVEKETGKYSSIVKKYVQEYDKISVDYIQKIGIENGKLVSESEFIDLTNEYNQKLKKLWNKYNIEELFEEVIKEKDYKNTTSEAYSKEIEYAKEGIINWLRPSNEVVSAQGKAMYSYLKKNGFKSENNDTSKNTGVHYYTTNDGILKISYNEKNDATLLITPYNPSSPIDVVKNKQNSNDVSLKIDSLNQGYAIIDLLQNDGNLSNLPSTFIYDNKTYNLKRKNLKQIINREENKNKGLYGIKDSESALKYLKNDYSDEEIGHLNNSKSTLITNEEDLKNYVYNAINNPESIKLKAIIGRITDSTANNLKKDTGIDFRNFSLAYDKNNIKHIIKKHITNSKENLPLEYNDLFNFPYIMENYDTAKIADNGKLIVTKWIKDQYQLVAEYSMKSKNLVLNSLYKIKKERNKSLPVVHDSSTKSLLGTPEAQSGVSSSSTNIISQNGYEDTTNVEKEQRTEYNNNIEGERFDEFRRIQEESRRITKEEQQLFNSGNKEIDESLRRRLSRTYESILKTRSSFASDGHGLLDNTGNFKIIKDVDGNLFHDIFEINKKYLKYGELVDLHDNYNDAICYLSEDGLSGFAITKDGDLISVFNLNNKKGWLRAIADEIKTNAKTLDCYISINQPLNEMYESKFGFKTASIMDYNMEYDHDNIANNHNKPQVAFMVNTSNDVKLKHFNKNQYDAAKEYQLSFFKNNVRIKEPSITISTESTTAIKDYANLRKDKVYSKISVEKAINNVIDIIQDEIDKDLNLELSTKSSIIRKSFEDINKKDIDYTISNIIENISNSEIIIKSKIDNDAKEENIKLSDFFSQSVIEDIRKELIEYFNSNGSETFLVKMNNRIANLISKIINENDRFKLYVEARNKIDSLKKEFEIANKYTSTGKLPVEEVGLWKPFVNGLKLTRSRLGISPKSVSNLVATFTTYTEDNFKDSVLGFNNDIRQIVDEFAEIIKEPGFNNRSLTMEETKKIINILDFIKHSINELKSQKTLDNIKIAKSGIIVTSASINNKKLNSKRTILGNINDTVISPVQMIYNAIGRKHPFSELITREWLEVDGNQYKVSTGFYKEIFESIPKDFNMTTEKFASILSKKVFFRNVRMTISNIVDLYFTLYSIGYNNEEMQTDLMTNGFTFKNPNKHRTDKFDFSNDKYDDVLNEVIDLIPTEIKSIVDSILLDGFNGILRDYAFAKYKEFTGIEIDKQEMYYPSSRGFLNNNGLANMNSYKGFLSTMGQSWQKKRRKIKAPYEIRDFASVTTHYINQISFFGTKSQWIDKYRVMLNTKYNGYSLNNLFEMVIPNWKSNITGSKDNLQSYLNKIILDQSLAANSGGILEKIKGVQLAKVAANISSTFKQILSDLTIAQEVGISGWIKSMSQAVNNLFHYKKVYKELRESGVLQKRWDSNEAILSKVSGFNRTKGAFKKLLDILSFGMSKIDEAVIVTHVYAVAQYLAEQDGFGPIGSSSNSKEALSRTELLVALTQSNSIKMFMSPLRSGNIGQIEQLAFGMYASDAQNKYQGLNSLVQEQRNAERRISDLEDYLKENENNNDISEEDKEILRDYINKDKNRYSKKKFYDRFSGFLIAAIIGGIAAVSITILKKLITKQIDKEDLKDENIPLDMLLEATISWIPYLGTFTNSIRNNTDLSLLTFDEINSFVNTVSELSTAIQNGNENKIRSSIIKLAMRLSEWTGFPATNLYQLITGGIGWIDEDLQITIKNYIEGYSSNSMKTKYNDSISKGMVGRAAKYLNVWSYTYSTPLNEVQSKEIARLSKEGYDAVPSVIPTTYTNDEGETVSLTKSQNSEFAKYYRQAQNELDKIINSSEYKSLDDEYKAKTLKLLFNSYYSLAKNEALGISSSGRLNKLIIYTKGNLNVAKIVLGFGLLQSINTEGKKDKKNILLRELNNLNGYNKNERLIIMLLLGYSVSEINEKMLVSYLKNRGAKINNLSDIF